MRRALAFLTPFGGAAGPVAGHARLVPGRGRRHRARRGGGVVVGGPGVAARGAAGVVLVSDVVLTGYLHLDGLADAADGLLPPMTRERRLEVMADPAVGCLRGGDPVRGARPALRRLRVDCCRLRSWSGPCGAARARPWPWSRGCVPYARPGGLAAAFVDAPHRGAAAWHRRTHWPARSSPGAGGRWSARADAGDGRGGPGYPRRGGRGGGAGGHRGGGRPVRPATDRGLHRRRARRRRGGRRDDRPRWCWRRNGEDAGAGRPEVGAGGRPGRGRGPWRRPSGSWPTPRGRAVRRSAPGAALRAVHEPGRDAAYRDSRSAGVVHAAIGTGLGVAGGLRSSAPPPAATYLAVAGRALRDVATSIGDALESSDLDRARELLPSLVGRDVAEPRRLGMARAVVESVAENTVDAVVAPAWWAAVGGAPGVLGYRAVNTMDAMVGYRSDRYLRYGWASARLDDVAAFVPARLTAVLVAVVRPRSRPRRLAGGADPGAVASLPRTPAWPKPPSPPPWTSASGAPTATGSPRRPPRSGDGTQRAGPGDIGRAVSCPRTWARRSASVPRRSRAWPWWPERPRTTGRWRR